MMTNRNFEKNAAYRSRLALLVTLLVYMGLAALILFRNGDVKLEKAATKTENVSNVARP